MNKEQLLYLSQAEVASVGVSMAEIIELLETAFLEKGKGKVVAVPRRRNPVFLHGLEKRGLGLGRGTVYFIGEQHVGEHRPL